MTLYLVQRGEHADGPFTEEEVEAIYPRVVVDAPLPETLPDPPVCPSLAASERSALLASLNRARKMTDEDMREALAAIVRALARGRTSTLDPAAPPG